MPGLDGTGMLSKLCANPLTCDIPVIFVTALSKSVNEQRGLELGAADLISKPIQPMLVLSSVRVQLEAKQARDWMKDQNAALEAEVS